MSDWENAEGEHWATNADRYTRVLPPLRRCSSIALAPLAGRAGSSTWVAATATWRSPWAQCADGAVVGVDLSPDMLAVARSRAEHAGLDHVELIQADASRWRTPTDPFDAATSRFGVMFFDDPVAAFATSGPPGPGAQFVFACWQTLFDNRWMFLPAAAVASAPAAGARRSPRTEPFAFADRDRVAALLGEAGFAGWTSRCLRRSGSATTPRTPQRGSSRPPGWVGSSSPRRRPGRRRRHGPPPTPCARRTPGRHRAVGRRLARPPPPGRPAPSGAVALSGSADQSGRAPGVR